MWSQSKTKLVLDMASSSPKKWWEEMLIHKLSTYPFVMTNNLSCNSFRSVGKSQGPQRVLGNCRKFSFRDLSLFWDRCEYSVLIYRICLPCLSNDFGYWTQKQGRWCSVVRLLGAVFFLFIDWDFPRVYPILDSILFCFQACIFALGDVASNSWCKIPLRQFS